MTQPKNEQNGSSMSTGSGMQSGSSIGSSIGSSTGSSMGSPGSSIGSSVTRPGIGSTTDDSLQTRSGESQKPADPQKSAERLREDIARTRSALSEDMAALGGKLSPDHLKENAKEVLQHASVAAREGAKDMVRDAKDAALDSLRHAKDHAFESISEELHEIGDRARAAGHTVSDFVATHAVPLALLGAGCGWLLISMSHQRRLIGPDYRRLGSDYERYGEYDEAGYGREGMLDRARGRAGAISNRATHALAEGRNALAEGRDRLVGRAHDIEEKVVERAGELRSKVTEGVSHLGEQASHLGHRAYDGIGRAGRGAVRVSEQNPLATGLLIMAAGVAAGILLPSTRRENQLLGSTRDRLLDRAQRSASELKQSVQSGAGELRGAISELTHSSH